MPLQPEQHHEQADRFLDWQGRVGMAFDAAWNRWAESKDFTQRDLWAIRAAVLSRLEERMRVEDDDQEVAA